MKLTVAAVLVLATLAVYVEGNLLALLKSYQTASRTCKRKTGATENDISVLQKLEVPETRSGQCYAICVVKKMELVSADNKINFAKIKDLIASVGGKDGKYKKPLEIAEQCSKKGISDPDECLVAKKMMSCLKEGGISSKMG